MSNKLRGTKNNKTFKKREREIKNTKIYTGSTFLKGYVQSFANTQRIPLKRSQDQFSIIQTHLLPASQQTAPSNTQHPCSQQVNTAPCSTQHPCSQQVNTTPCSTQPTVSHSSCESNIENYHTKIDHETFVIYTSQPTVQEISIQYHKTTVLLHTKDYKRMNE